MTDKVGSEFFVNIITNGEQESGESSSPPLRLAFSQDSIRLSTLIEQRVLAEIDAYESDKNSLNCLIRLDLTELHIITPSEKININRSKAVQRALDEFRDFKYIVIVNQQHITDLDEEIPVRNHMKVAFFKLPALVSG